MKIRILISSVLSLSLIATSLPSQAGMVNTTQLLAQEARTIHLAQVQAFVARDDVRSHMEALGVDPTLAAERVAALTDSELQQLSNDIENLPAGSGVLGLAIAVLVILILLEITGLINIFPKI